MSEDLNLFAQPGSALTQPQSPFCAIAQRVQPADRWAYRYPITGLGAPIVLPPEYVINKRIEYRVPGAAAYEITLTETVAWAESIFAIPPGAVFSDVEAVSGLTRLSVRSGGFEGQRFHHGRRTLVVVGDVCKVDVLRPATSVLIDINALPSSAVSGRSDAIVIVRSAVRIVAVPARSREPSEWRIADIIQTGIGYPRLQLVPGISDLMIVGVGPNDPGFTASLATMPEGLGGPLIPIIDLFNWAETDGVSHLDILDGETGHTLQLVQRGWI